MSFCEELSGSLLDSGPAAIFDFQNTERREVETEMVDLGEAVCAGGAYKTLGGFNGITDSLRLA